MAEISSLVTSEVHGIPVKAISRSSKLLVPFAQIIGVFQLPKIYDSSTISRKRRSLGLADYYATSNELVLLRKEKLLSSNTNKCLMVERGDAEVYIMSIVKGLRMTKDEFLNNIRPKSGESTSLESLSDVNDTEATSLESLPDVTNMEAIEHSEYQQCESFTESSSKCEDSPFKTVEMQKSKKGRKRLLSDSWMSEELTDEMKKLKEFYERPFNHERRGAPLTTATIKKTLQHIQMFFDYCRRNGHDATISAVLDSSLLDNFFKFLKDDRESSPGTLSCYGQSLLRVVRYLSKEKDLLDVPQAQVLRTYVNQTQKEAEVHREKSWEELKAKGHWLSWEEILDVVRQVHHNYFSSTAWDRVTTCRTLVMLLLYTAIPPGRGKEYRELKYKCHEKEISGALDTSPNVIHYSEYEGKAVLYLTEYKTASSAGPQLVKCPKDAYFMEILGDYLLRYRKKIPNSYNSDLVFLNDSGHPYDETTWSRYIYTVFNSYTGAHVSIHTLRSAFITYAGKNSSKMVMDSLALSMRHSPKYQQAIYDKRTSQERLDPGLEFAAKRFKKAMESPSPCLVKEPTRVSTPPPINIESSSDEESTTVVEGDMVALFAADSTKKNPEVLFAKVVSIKDSTGSALLNEMVETSPGLYRLKLGSRWEEKLKTLVTGLDWFYVREKSGYELRTPFHEILLMQPQSCNSETL